MVEATSEGTEVITGTEGKGITQGLAAAEQKAGAEGGAKRVTVTKFIESDGKGLFEVEKVDQSTVRSASGHQASSKRFGTFKVLNLGATAVNTAGLVALPQATGERACTARTEPTALERRAYSGRATRCEDGVCCHLMSLWCSPSLSLSYIF